MPSYSVEGWPSEDRRVPEPTMLVSVQTAANLAYCSEDEVWDLLAAGKIVGQKIKGKVFVGVDEVTEALRDQGSAA